jgi:hypothetical protein
MFCCAECFSSSYLKGIINSSGSVGDCNYCDSKGVSVYEPRQLALFFQNIFDLYKGSRTGKTIEIQIESDFQGKIFSPKVTNRKALLQEIIADDAIYQKLFRQKVVLKHVSDRSIENKTKPLQISWEKFAEEIKSTNRFHIQNTLDLEKLKDLLIRYEKHIPKGKIFYRARISDSNLGYKKDEMANPPAYRAKAGRANPTGISYLYLANDIKTTLYEARSSLYDYVTIGDFRLKEDIRVINLRGDTYDPIPLAEQGELKDFLIHLPFISKLEQELSKPRRRSDNELDYLPTQYLSEFIKSLGYDGVEYQSSLYSSGYNLAMFNTKKLDCIKVSMYEIENIDLTHKKLEFN